MVYPTDPAEKACVLNMELEGSETTEAEQTTLKNSSKNLEKMLSDIDVKLEKKLQDIEVHQNVWFEKIEYLLKTFCANSKNVSSNEHTCMRHHVDSKEQLHQSPNKIKEESGNSGEEPPPKSPKTTE